MPKWKASVLIVLATVLCMAQTATEYESSDVVSIAGKLQCNCGCHLNMACVMPPTGICPVCKAAKIRIATMRQEGKSEQQVLDQFVSEMGPSVLVVPPGVGGFSAPYIALALGLGLVAWAIRRYRKMRPAPVTPAGDDEALSRYHDQIEKDQAKLE
jgi:cytochrome c-type biogenesis protein CcmH/NrfF